MKKRILSLTLVLCMILTLFPASVFAYGTTPEAGDPVCSDPIYSDPIYSDPVYSDPVYTDPVTSDPATTDPTVVASGTCGENLTWVLDNSGTLTISGTGNMMNYDEEDEYFAPWSIYCEKISNVVINEGVTSIGNRAFVLCAGLTSVTIPNSVTSIGDYAFFNCDSLTNVSIPDSVTYIGDYVFAGCTELKSVTIPDSVTRIEDSAFAFCKSLTCMTIPSSVTNIIYGAFCYCCSLTSVSISNNVTFIDDYAFCGCESLADVYYFGSEEEWNAINIGGDNDCLTNAAIHYNVSDIDSHYIATEVVEPTCTEDGYTVYTCPCGYSYEICAAATGHNFVDGECTRCGVRVKYACIGETRVDIPENETIYLRFIPEESGYYSVTSICDKDTYGYLYDGEMNLITENDDSGDAYNFLIHSYLEAGKTYCIGVRTYSGNASSADVCISKATTEGTCGAEGDNLTWTLDDEGTLTISGTGDMMNYYGDSDTPWYDSREEIRNVVITEGVTNIGDWVFISCYNLTSVTIPNSVTSIGDHAFDNCRNLTSVDIPDSVTIIGDHAFAFCNITSITIPNSVTSIGDRAFEYCYSLTEINVSENNEYYCSVDGVLFNKEKTELIQYPRAKTGESYIVPNSVVIIRDHAFSDCYNLTSVTIPDSVTSIGDSAFAACSNLTSVDIPDSVTSIGYGVFQGCQNLTNVSIPDSVTSIGSSAFAYCCDLTSLDIPDSVTSIGDRAFAHCSSLTSITIPDSVTSIGDYMFYDCNSLTSITIPDSVTSIVYATIGGCRSLASITIPDSVTSIGDWAFSVCDNLADVYYKGNKEDWRVINIGDGNENLTNANMHFADEPIHIHDYTATVTTPSCTEQGYTTHACECGARYVDTYVASLGHNFVDGECTRCGVRVKYACIGETRVDIPENETIYLRFIPEENGLYSFTTLSDEDTYGYLYDGEMNLITENDDGGENNNFLICRYLEAGKTYCIGVRTYSGNASSADVCISKATTEGTCGAEGDNLTWTLDSNGTLTISGTGDMMNYDDAYYVPWGGYREGISNVIITEGVTSIGDWAFYDFDNLMNVTIPDNVTSIGNHAFCNCYNLTSVTIPNSVTSIGLEAFSDCINLTNVTIPDSVTSIGSNAFGSCFNLTSITIPDSVTSIGDRAFEYCYSLTEINVSENNEYYCSVDGVLFNKEKTELIQYPCAKTGESYIVPNSVVIIRDNAFEYCSSLTSITIPDSVTSIGGNAFSDCYNLTSVTIPDSVTSIGYGAFYDCYGLTSVTIPDSVTSIGDSAFEYCSSLTSITIPDSVTSIGSGAFYNCSSLASITIPDSVTSIGDYAFYNCNNLTSVDIPDSVASIGNEAFAWCNSLTEINVSENNEYYCSADGVLFNKEKTELIQYPCGKSGESYTIPDSVTRIGYGVFQGCQNLTNVSIPDSVTYIGDYVFAYCNITSITIPDSVTGIGDGAFDSCGNLADVYYSGSEEEWNAINIGEENECLTNATIHFAGEPICDHNYTATVTAPNCTEQGYTTYTCDNCGDSYTADYVDAIGHNFVNGKCTECGATAPVAREGFIVVSDERARAGEEVTVSVSVEENPGIMVMVLGFDYDKSKLELIGYEDGLMSGWKVASNAVWIGGDSVYEDGVILKLKFKVLDDVEDGEVKVSVLFAEGDIANHDEQIIMPEELDGGITVYTNIPGDITGDDIVNALDLVRLQRYLTGEAVAVAASCDVNGDGLINAQDLVRLQRYLSGENIVIY